MSKWLKCSIDNLYHNELFKNTSFLYTSNPGVAIKKGSETVTLLDIVTKDYFSLIITRDSYESIKELEELLSHVESNKNKIIFLDENEKVDLDLIRIGSRSFRLASGAVFNLHGYCFEIEAESLLEFSEEGNEALLTDGGFLFGLLGKYCCFGKSLRLELDKDLGCFKFCLHHINDLSGLGVYIKYTLENEEQTARKHITQVSFLPLKPLVNHFDVNVSLDVLHPENYDRSFFELPVGSYETGFAVAFNSNISLKLGRKKDAVLVFAREKQFKYNDEFRYYLTPNGRFEIDSSDGELLTGTGGLEYIKFDKGASLYFKAGCRAHFMLNKETDTIGNTSYVSAEGIYYSQAQSSAFFAKASDRSYEFMEIPFGESGEQTAIPILPLGASKSALDAQGGDIAERLDTIYLAPLRNRIMSEISLVADENAMPKQAVNENGLIVTYLEGEDYFRTLEISDNFRFRNVKGALKRAILSPQPFIVLHGKNPLGDEAEFITEDEPLSIDDWNFDFSPENWDDDTLLIMKYSSEKSIAEFAQTEDGWSFPQDKNEVGTAAKKIRNLLPKDGETDFSGLKIKLMDKSWCGAVIISMPINYKSFPHELKFLISIGPPIRLKLDHMVFDNRSIDENGEILPAAISGLIDFKDYNYKVTNSQLHFLYRVNAISVEFRNTAVYDFNCEMSLAFNYLFGSPLYAKESKTGNFIPMKGWRSREQEMGSASKYHFEIAEEIKYQFKGSAIDYMIVDSASLSASDIGGKISFFFGGKLGFNNYERDIFSYGEYKKSDKIDRNSESSLKFTGLEVFAEGENYGANTGAMKYLCDLSEPRDNSIGQCFKISVKDIFEARNKTPENYQFEAINVDGITQKELDDNWTGMSFELSLGGLGSLASFTEMKLILLLAWSAGENKKEYDGNVKTEPPGLYVGLRLGEFPGFSAALPLEGVMSLGFQAFELKYHKESGEFYFLMKDFVLKLLKFQFPSGSSSIYIFGNKQNRDMLAWYGAYDA